MMRWGFKAEAERIAFEVRQELDLEATDRLDPFALARHLAIPVFRISEVGAETGQPWVGQHFITEGSDSFSAVTVFDDRRRIIVFNERHAPTRQASDLSHEIAHCLLEHEPGPLSADGGNRYWDGEMEEEASWLGAALLVPRAGVFSLFRRGNSPEDVAEIYGVSMDLLIWRVRQTGVITHLRRLEGWKRAASRPTIRRTPSVQS